MGRYWSGFLPQNELVKLQWSVLEACQAEATAKALGIFMPGVRSVDAGSLDEDPEEDLWETVESGLRQSKI